MKLKDINFPKGLKYSYNNVNKPYEFYYEAFSASKEVKFLLGYFSTNAIHSLMPAFYQFLLNEGKLTFAINQFISRKDYEELFNFDESKDEVPVNFFENIKELRSRMSNDRKFFFNCLRFLKKEGRLKFIIIKPKGKNISHFKESIFSDGVNKVYANGSSNFTASGLLGNAESIIISRSWGDDSEKSRIIDSENEFQKIYTKEASQFDYLSINDFEIIDHSSEEKTLNELIEDGKKVLNQLIDTDQLLRSKFREYERRADKRIKEIEMEPKFPYDKPRDYQIEAYEAWVVNKYKGIFAMATGTGKTLTALNCAISLKITKLIVVVPGKELVEQWAKELTDCNFKNIYKWYSGNTRLNADAEAIYDLRNYTHLCVVVTYDSFKTDRFKNIFSNDFSEILVIFDEVHNFGAPGFIKDLDSLRFNKVIGLSATPKRIWDDLDSNIIIEEFFQSPPPYTYSFSMKRAIDEKYLCKYYYKPHFSYLSDNEWELYKYYTSLIPIAGENEEINSKAALKRQLVVDQSEGKIEVLLDIIREFKDKNKLGYTLVYCPKGEFPEDVENIEYEGRIIYKIGELIRDEFNSKINTHFFVGETQGRKELLSLFEDGEIDLLLAIKCLDEGVNIPRTENAIFVASGKNEREFIQRRGRVLRNYSNNNFTKNHANIIDIICLPTISQYNSDPKIARRMVLNEFKRVYEFYKLAEQDINVFRTLDEKIEEYNLTRYYIENLIENE